MTDEHKDKPPWWVSATQTLGLPTAFLLIVLFMLWRAGAYMSAEVVMPLFQRQVTFIDTATKTLADTQLASNAVKQGQEQGHASLRQLDDTTTQTAVDVKRILELTKEIEFILKSQAKAPDNGQ